MQEISYQQSDISVPSDSASELNLNSLLRSWVNVHGIKTRAVNDLLKILKSTGLCLKFMHICYFIDPHKIHLIQELICINIDLFLANPSLPKDYRSLLHTPRFIDISAVGNGQMWYNGIEKSLRIVFSKLNEDKCIALNFNVDGLPIFKSSQKTFWPILASIHKMPEIQPMVIAIWSGPTSKPDDLNAYLSKFVKELNELLENGISVNDYHIHISIRSFLCDTPARAFLKGIYQTNLTNVFLQLEKFLMPIIIISFYRNRLFQS